MATLTIASWAYPFVLLALLVFTGVAEYLHIAPAGSFYTVLLLVLGIIVPSPVQHSPIANVGTAETVQVETRPPDLRQG